MVMKAIFRTAIVLILACIAVSGLQQTEAEETANVSAREKVLELEPVGYWPLDEGEGEVLHDRSNHDNHGRAHFLSWKNGLLDFDNDVYQWVQIPHHPDYASRAFSMGGWVLNRKEYAADKGLFGVILMGQPFKPKNGKLKWEALWGDRVKGDAAMLRFGPPANGKGALVEVVSGGQKDAIGSVDGEIALQADKWQHVLYTYDGSGTGKLYRNGRLVHSSENVSYRTDETPYVIGGGRWGTHNLGGTISLDGSVRHMVLFDRALSSEEVKHLYEHTQPNAVPSGSDETANDSEVTSPAKEELIKQVQNKTLEKDVRAEAALRLAEMGADASDAVPALLEVLTREADGVHLPKIEEILRNAVMRALLDIAPRNEHVRNILGRKLAKPFLDSLDLSKPYLDSIRPLAEKWRYMEALDLLHDHLQDVSELPNLTKSWGSTQNVVDPLRDVLPLREVYRDKFFSRGFPFHAAHYHAYNQFDVINGTAYITEVERVPFEEVKRIYENTLSEFTDERPDSEGKWTRLKVIFLDGEGNKEMAYLGGPWFMFDAGDMKYDGWTIAVDKKGYIHLQGGQHNRPRKEDYVPGSWEKFGISSAEIMYWVSKEPGKIGSFEFVGQRDNPRRIRGWTEYPQFIRSPGGTLFLYGRGNQWTWTLKRYDASERRWTNIHGNAGRMMDQARRENPEWYKALGDTVPYYGPSNGFVVAWQPGAYNFCRPWNGVLRGVTFDKTGRMHVQLQILGVGREGRMTHGTHGLVYAYSDDLGETFHRADGTRLTLPLTVNPIPGHDANMEHHSTQQWFDLWISLIQEAGWKTNGGFDR